MYQDVKVIAQACHALLTGQKINSRDYPGHIVSAFLDQLRIMHAGFFIAPEPQSYVRTKQIAEIDQKYMGQTDVHPLPLALVSEARNLKEFCVNQGLQVPAFEILGLHLDKRADWRSGEPFQLGKGKVGVLLPGDINALWQLASLIEFRKSQPSNVYHTQPIIIQNSGHFWEPMLRTNVGGWTTDERKLNRLNIFVTHGMSETAELLASLDRLPRIVPNELDISFTTQIAAQNSDDIFATGDPIKFGQSKDAHKTYGSGSFRRSMEIFGPSEIPPEETYSLEGNAAYKMKAFYDVLRSIGRDQILHLLARRGYKDISNIKIVINDGGLGFCLENSSGKRYIDLFTADEFPDSVDRLNPIQMGPGVELAEMRKTIGMQAAMAKLERSVANVVADNPEFTRDDLVAYDGSVFMSVPLTRLLEAIDAKEEFDLHQFGVISVFSGQRLQVSPQPFGMSQHDVPQTEHYLMPPDSTLVRAEIKDWHMQTNAPNVTSISLLKQAMGITATEAAAISRAKDIKYSLKMGVLGVSDALTCLTPTPTYDALKRTLRRDFGISTQQGPDYWYRFAIQDPDQASDQAERGFFNQVLDQAARGVPMTGYLSGLTRLFDASRIVYVDKSYHQPKSEVKKLITHLAMLEGVVRNQVFRNNDVVVNTDAVSDLLKDIRWKQYLGLVQQKTEHLFIPVTNVEEAAEIIANRVRQGHDSVTELQAQYYTDGQIELDDCMKVTVYLSATNKNKTLSNQVHRLGYLLGLNGFSVKVGGGNEGLMRELADGFQLAKQELSAKGYEFPSQLILIQCAHTEAIEKRYDGGGIFRSHVDIAPRMADLQATDMEVFGASGTGGTQEAHCSFLSRKQGLINPSRTPFIFFNQQLQSPEGQVGVHDQYRGMFSREFYRDINADNWVMTPEEVVAQASAHRTKILATSAIKLSDVRRSLSAAHHHAADPKPAMSRGYKWFVPPYPMYTGPEGGLPAPNAAHLPLAAAVPEKKLA